MSDTVQDLAATIGDEYTHHKMGELMTDCNFATVTACDKNLTPVCMTHHQAARFCMAKAYVEKEAATRRWNEVFDMYCRFNCGETKK